MMLLIRHADRLAHQYPVICQILSSQLATTGGAHAGNGLCNLTPIEKVTTLFCQYIKKIRDSRKFEQLAFSDQPSRMARAQVLRLISAQ